MPARLRTCLSVSTGTGSNVAEIRVGLRFLWCEGQLKHMHPIIRAHPLLELA